MTATATNAIRRPGFSLAAAARMIATALQARRQRAVLATLDDARLRDLGLSRAAALREASRPIWDVPAHWQRRNW